jgi:ACS family allantoate permease-like MFS transporter
VCGYLGDRTKNRILVAMSGLLIAITGMSLIVGLPLHNNKGRLAGYYLTQASPTPFVAFLSLISSNVAGYTKKVRRTFVTGKVLTWLLTQRTFRPQWQPSILSVTA